MSLFSNGYRSKNEYKVMWNGHSFNPKMHFKIIMCQSGECQANKLY